MMRLNRLKLTLSGCKGFVQGFLAQVPAGFGKNIMNQLKIGRITGPGTRLCLVICVVIASVQRR